MIIPQTAASDQKQMEELVTGQAIETLILTGNIYKCSAGQSEVPEWPAPSSDSKRMSIPWCLDASRLSLKSITIKMVSSGYYDLVCQLGTLFPNLEEVILDGITNLSTTMFSGLTKLRKLELWANFDLGPKLELSEPTSFTPLTPAVQELFKSPWRIDRCLGTLITILEEHKDTLREVVCPFHFDWSSSYGAGTEGKDYIPATGNLLYDTLLRLHLTKLEFSDRTSLGKQNLLSYISSRR
jgi:hypothetical protein